MHVSRMMEGRRIGRSCFALRLGLLLLLCGACSRRHVQPIAAPPVPTDQRAQVKAPEPVQPASPPSPAQAAPWTQTVSSAVVAAPPQPAKENTEEEKPPRDLAAELQAMMAQASACLESRVAGEGPTGTELAVTAHIMPSGAVRHGDASGSGLKPQELACVKRQVESLHFAPPIENAPTSVSAARKLEFTLTRAAPPAAGAKPPDGNKPVMPTADGRTPGVLPPSDPGVVPPEDPGVVPPGDPGVVPAEAPGTVPPPDPPAEVLAPPPPLPPEY
jgi:hypothetical protein